MNKYCAKHLEYLTRHGLNVRVLMEYKSCGMIYFSKYNHANKNATLDRFVDFAGIDREIIKLVDRLETELNISPYHVLIDESGQEIVVLYVDNKIDKDYQYEMFTKRQALGISIYPDTKKWLYKDVNYDIVLGAIIDNDFN